MKALMLHQFSDYRVDGVTDPVPADDEVVINVSCVQPSVTECNLLSGDDVAMHTQLAHRLESGPVAFGGHEFSGVIGELGAEVRGWLVGDRVTAVESIRCGMCRACRAGMFEACCRTSVIGFSRPGAFAEQVAVPAANLVRLPLSFSASAAAALQPLAGAVHAHDAARMRPGESVLVLGAGVMGLLAVQLARRGGAGLIVCTSRSLRKRSLAAHFGATATIDPADDVAAAGIELTDGIGFDVVIETAGGPETAGLAGTSTLDTAVRAVRRGGRIVMVSVQPAHVDAPLGLMREKGITLLHPPSGAGAFSSSSSVFDHAVRLVDRGDVDVSTLITHQFTGFESLPAAIGMTLNKAAHGAINPPQVHLAESWDDVSSLAPAR